MGIKQRYSVVFVKIKFEIGGIKNYSLGAVWRAKAVDFFGSGSLGAAYFLFCFDQLSFKPMVRLNTSFSAVLSWSTQK